MTHIQLGDVGSDAEQTVWLQWPDREENLSCCDQRDDFKLQVTGLCQRGPLAFKVSGSKLQRQHGEDIMPDCDFAGEAGLAVETASVTGVERIKFVRSAGGIYSCFQRQIVGRQIPC